MEGRARWSTLGAIFNHGSPSARCVAGVEEKMEEAVVHTSAVPSDSACMGLRAHFVLMFAAVYGLSDADSSTVGTVPTQLRRSLALSNFDIGMLASVSVGIGALTALPAGELADRFNRARLLAGAVFLWSAAMALSSLASSFALLMATRVLLGGTVTVAGPATVSLLGDLWPASDRGRIYGIFTCGQLIGAGVRLRAAFLVMLALLILSGVLVAAARSYPKDRVGALRNDHTNALAQLVQTSD